MKRLARTDVIHGAAPAAPPRTHATPHVRITRAPQRRTTPVERRSHDRRAAPVWAAPDIVDPAGEHRGVWLRLLRGLFMVLPGVPFVAISAIAVLAVWVVISLVISAAAGALVMMILTR